MAGTIGGYSGDSTKDGVAPGAKLAFFDGNAGGGEWH